MDVFAAVGVVAAYGAGSYATGPVVAELAVIGSIAAFGGASAFLVALFVVPAPATVAAA